MCVFVSVCMWFCCGASLSIVCKLIHRNSSILFSVLFMFIVVSLRAVKLSNLCLSGKYYYDFFFFVYTTGVCCVDSFVYHRPFASFRDSLVWDGAPTRYLVVSVKSYVQRPSRKFRLEICQNSCWNLQPVHFQGFFFQRLS